MSSITSPIVYRSPVGYAYKLYLEGNLPSSLHILKTYFQEGCPKEGNLDSACSLYLQVSSELNHSWQKTLEWLKLVHNGPIPRSLLNELVITYGSKKTWESREQLAELLSLAEKFKTEIFADDRGYQVEEQLVKLACEWKLFPLAESLLVNPYQKGEADLSNFISEQKFQHKLKESLSADNPNNDATKERNALTSIKRFCSQLAARIGFLQNNSTWFPKNTNLLLIAFALVVLIFKIKGNISKIRRYPIVWESLQSFIEKLAFIIS
ncbi:Schizosaccharomyces specific protein [Schizosaccharomyces osmophilus]|uniref:Schizosaccharomyces specific protein n=1 Tax=Schizosaccharomyces osmophilus TaxID=2545709 RepID=A0AAE9WF33_9SCHI|nr:Schizosaccharomyces specific protein [Schizosaccharomyces osmophilus]WBW75236.1 Schizosaccharomyces specific protein [Schizosaccharomyces osmophilus]